MKVAATDARAWLARLLLAASGFAGLGYQIVWTQQTALWLGHESAAVLAVVTAFFGGIGLGALALGPRIERSLRPRRWYAGCELVIALWGLVLIGALAPISAAVLSATSVAAGPLRQWTVAFGTSFILFLPATAAMGATLPAMERLNVQAQQAARSPRATAVFAGLYASNTAGAVIGVLAAAFWLVPAIGLAGTTLVCVTLNLLCAVAAWWSFPATASAPTAAVLDRVAGRPRSGLTLARLALTGLLGIGYEIVVVRVLSQITEDTVYTFALLLAAYLAGSAAGAAAYQRWGAHRPDHDRLGNFLLTALASACLIGAATLWPAELLKTAGLRSFGGHLVGAIATEALLALVAFGPPTVVMGALFSHLCRCARADGVSFGRALGVNTLAAAAAPVLLGVLVVPALGAKIALVLIALGYLAAGGPRAWRTRRRAIWLPAGGAAALALFAPPLTFIDVPPGGHVVSYQEGAMAAVSVVEDAAGVARLRINNRQQEGSNATHRVDGRQAWLPALLHAAPRRALFLGLGTGVTAKAATEDPALNVDAVELLPEVITASAVFIGAPDPARLHLIAADARRYVRASDRNYDIVVSDNFHPARSGSGALTTTEHFAAVRRRLAPDGLFCQWLPLHQLDRDSLRSIVRSFLSVYPQAWALLANNSLDTPVLGLVARADGRRFDPAVIRDRLAQLAQAGIAQDLGLEDEWAVLGSFVAGPKVLQRLAGDAPANTDDRPIVAYRAPRITYAPDSLPRERLIGLLSELSLTPDELIAPPASAAATRQLAAYWTARTRFIVLGKDVRPSSDVQQMLAQVRLSLLSVLRISPDFRPAYDPLLSMALALARTDQSAAAALLTELRAIQPARGEADAALQAMSLPLAGATSDALPAVR
jgi:spermidine synthase